MESTQKEKKQLRESALAARTKISKEKWKNRSSVITEKVLDTEVYKNSTFIHLYMSMDDRNEVYTGELLNTAFEDNKKIIVPITQFDNHSLEHVYVDEHTQFSKNKWGVPEPIVHTAANIEDLELVLVPMVAADMSCNRLGYGQGFYDRFIKETSAVKLGLVFDDFVFDQIPVEPFDQKLDMIITEKRTISRNNV